MTNPDAQRLREQVLNDVERKAARDLSDTRYDFIRPLSRRRALTVASFALLVVYAIADYFDQSLIVLPVFLTWGASLFLLRMAIRGLTDYPDEIVDERIREVRGTTYRYAFMGVIVLLSGYLSIYIANQLLAKGGLVLPMTADQLHDLAFPLFFGCMMMPTAIFAWNERIV
ncbi:MAG: hypothetical protein AAGJ86_13335 [Pseudomonadota bacterium]